MRASSDPWFTQFLLNVDDGTEPSIGNDFICLLDEMIIPYTTKKESIHELIETVFPGLNQNGHRIDYIASRAILSTENEYVDRLNEHMIETYPEEELICHSIDTEEDDKHGTYPSEFLNSLMPNRLSPHILKLKMGCSIILLCNLDLANGLCNGTRLVCRNFQRNVIDVEIATGGHAGKRIFIPRILLSPLDDDLFPFRFKRKQFSVRLCFAMTINKAHGQTIPNVEVYLPEPVFSHGQMYVVLSRGVSRQNTKLLIKPSANIDPEDGTCTKHIVYREVLRKS